MILSTDNFSLIVALACVGAAFLAYLVLAVFGDRWLQTKLAAYARGAYYASAISLAYASTYLMQQILSNRRYDIAYIHDYSSPTDALLYRVSAFWAGQQGSLLLWGLIGAVIGAALIRKLAESAPILAAFWCSVQTFICLLLVTADPFAKLANYQPGMIGVGLNPLLKNPWMAIHPPVVFLGYAALAVPAAFAALALVKGDAARWARACLPWALFGWVSLSAGIILGMVWSYEVLGWGGYWGWDPVENASLVPWLTSTALVHGLVLQRYRGKMARSNIVMAFVTFLAVIYATFLTRSGVLADFSVHSFADLGGYGLLLGTLVFYAATCLVLLAVGWRRLASGPGALRPGSRDFALILGVIALGLLALVVLVGTSWPLIAHSGVQPSFYTHMSVPVAVLMVVLIAIAPLAAWGRDEASAASTGPRRWLFGALAASVLLSLVCGVIALALPALARRVFGWLVPPGHPMFGIAVPSMLLLIVSAALALAVSLGKGAKTTPARCGAYVAHAGVALMVLGIVTSSTGGSATLSLTQGGSAQRVFGWLFSYEGRKSAGESKEVLSVVAERGGKQFRAPLSIEYTERGSLRSPHIRSTVLGDLYVSPVDAQGTTVTPAATVAERDWISMPARLGANGASVALLGMQVEEHLARLEYHPRSGKAVPFDVVEGRPVVIDGYTFVYRKVTLSESDDHRSVTAGVVLDVSGHGLKDKVVIEVSTKPLMSALWLGTALILLGGVMSTLRRRNENSRGKDGLLSDSD